MKVLVTGGAGFLGPHVAKAFLNRGDQVTLMDIVEPKMSGPFIKADLVCLDDMLKATQGFDLVCHLGGVGDVYLAKEKPYLAAAANVLGTTNLMESCLQNQVKKVVYASTWEVYGEPQYQPLDEKHPCRPDHPYNITKLGGEQMALIYDHFKGIPVVSLRLATSYGTGMRENSVFSIFIRKALKGEPIQIQGDGSQYRQFTHAADVARAFVLAAQSPLHGEIFNIVNDETISIRQLAELIVKENPTQLTFGEKRPGDIAPAKVSADKARQQLNWKAEIPFAEGLKELISEGKQKYL